MPSVPLADQPSPTSPAAPGPARPRPESPLSPPVPAKAADASAGARDGGDFNAIADEAEPGLVREFVDFLRENRKWWLAPIVAMLLLVGMVLLFGGTAAAPFIYTLF